MKKRPERRPPTAVILIGGLGTRLRPFTCETPKPLLPLVNVPFLEHQFSLLRRHGIKEVALCTSYLPRLFRRAFGSGARLGLRLRYVHERHPLGTGGALKNAAPFLRGTALVLNGDILNDLDLTAFLAFHRKNDAEVTIALTRVKDPTLYGLVETDPQGHIRKFLEKPSWDEVVTNTVNAGAYLFEPHVLSDIPPGVGYSLERALFPALLQTRARFMGYVTRGYWMDIGTVDKYLQVHLDILSGVAPFKLSGLKRGPGGVLLSPGARLGAELTVGADGSHVVIGAGAHVGDFVRFSGSVCVGPRCVIGRGAQLENCVVLEGTRVGEGASLKGCVVGARCRVGASAVLSPGRALGGGSAVEAFSSL